VTVPAPILTTALCVDCKTLRNVKADGTCESCGSASIYRPGSVAVLERARRFKAAFDACWRM
jgi:hypothetical protein